MGWLENLEKRANRKIKIGDKINCINPSHKDKEPSMQIYEDHAYCFGCKYLYPSKKTRKLEDLFFMIDEFQENVSRFYKIQPFFYDKNKIFWMWDWDKNCYEMCDEIELMTLIDENLKFRGNTITSGIKNNYVEAFKRFGRKQKPDDPDKNWVQFGSYITIINKDSKWGDEGFTATPKYLFANPIPWDIGKSINTPVMDKLFTEWVGEEYVETLYEIIAYCCLTDYPIHLVFVLVGCGRNGKSQFQKVLQKFLGMNNICSTELDLLIDNRFESAKLFKKLVCSLGETNFGIMKKTSLLKKLCGGDVIGYEFKNKNPFDDVNYAKIIINSNALPTSTDTSEGFYRRWMIIDFPNEFPEGKDIVNTIPEEEYNNLARKSIIILNKLVDNGKFANQGTIEERKNKYILSSNPLPHFIDGFCFKGVNSYVRTSELYNTFVQYLIKNKKRVVTRKEFHQSLLEEGFESRRTTKKINDEYVRDWYIDFLELSTLSTLSKNSQLTALDKGSSEKVVDKVVKVVKGKNEPETAKESKNELELSEESIEIKTKVIELSEDSINFQTKATELDVRMCISENGREMKIEDLKERLFLKDDLLIDKMLKGGLLFQKPSGTVRLL